MNSQGISQLIITVPFITPTHVFVGRDHAWSRKHTKIVHRQEYLPTVWAARNRKHAVPKCIEQRLRRIWQQLVGCTLWRNCSYSVPYSIYCDVCDSLDDLQEHSRKSEPWLNQFSDIKCPDQPGRYLVSISERSICQQNPFTKGHSSYVL